MNIYNNFFIDFMAPFFEGINLIFTNIITGIVQIFNIPNYINVINNYSKDIQGIGNLIIIISILFLLIIYLSIIILIIYSLKSLIHYKKNKYNQEIMIDEIERLTIDISRLRKENNNFLSKTNPYLCDIEYDEKGNITNKIDKGKNKFINLSIIDNKMKDYKKTNYNENITLEELCVHFRNYSANKLHLYYDINIIRAFIASLLTSKLIILNGETGIGKTSLAYAFGKMIDNKTTVIPIQSEWEDSREIFGYYNEFTNRYNETKMLISMYEALYKDDIYINLLDEMNISKVEHYFAEMLSILELPDNNDKLIHLTDSYEKNDPIKLIDGKIKVPDNMWYIGSINNDRIGYKITNKVYDRSMIINCNTNSKYFKAPETELIKISSKYLMKLFDDSIKKYTVSDDLLEKINELNRYINQKFSINISNRTINKFKKFVPSYIACGGIEIDAVDYFIANKILIQIQYIKNIKDVEECIQNINTIFGKNKTPECILYLENFKKNRRKAI